MIKTLKQNDKVVYENKKLRSFKSKEIIHEEEDRPEIKDSKAFLLHINCVH